MKTKTITSTLAAFLLLPFLVLATDYVIISQVLYDPIISDTYGEAVELYNPTSSTIDISNYIIKTTSSAADATIPLNTFMQPNSYFLITDINFNNYKDNESFPNPDYQESITLSNSNSGVALIHNNLTIDAIGWGNSSPLFESAPAPEVQQGKSLRRLTLTDTDNNLLDFSESAVILHNSTSLIQINPQNQTEQNSTINETLTNSTEINESNFFNVTLEVNNSTPSILNYSFSEDVLADEGYQILPEPAKTKTTLLVVTISEKDGFFDIEDINAIFNDEQLEYSTTEINETAFNIEFELNLPYYLEPKTYSINVSVKDKSNTFASQEIQFEYLSILSIDLDSSNLIFNEGSTTVLGDSLTSTVNKPTIQNTGNVALNLGVSANNFTSGTNLLPASILSYGFSQTETFPSIMKNTLSVTVLNITPTNSIPLSFKISIPETAVKGSYTTKVLVAGVAI